MSAKRGIPDRFLGNHQHEKKRSRAVDGEDQENLSPPVLVVQVESVSSAKHALPTEITFGKRGTRSLGQGAVRTRTLYFANVPFSTTADDVTALLAPFGRVASVRLPHMSGRPSGRAYADIASEGAALAVSALHGKSIGGRTIIVEFARETVPARKGVTEDVALPCVREDMQA